MSRTKRIYNSERWKNRAVRHYNAKYASFYRSLRNRGGVFSAENERAESLLDAGWAIYAGAYCYHPYKELDARCNCIDCIKTRTERNGKRRRANRIREKNYMLELF